MKALAFVLALTGVLCGPAFGETITIHISNFTFDHHDITIKSGTTVTWQNDDDIPHSIIQNDHTFHSPPLDTGDTFSMTFTTAGEIDYFCGFHAKMQGKIIVTQ